MQTRDFCFWLQGLLEVGKIETLDADQVALIKAHLDLVFKHDVNIKPKEMEHTARPRPTLIATPDHLGAQGAPFMDMGITATC
jgi:hypothetical protein